MAYQALYRQWRPLQFEEVVGQEAIVRTLRRQVETGRIAHAYLFCGCRGTGKTTLAKIMSRAVNCLHPAHGDPCGECEPCRAILAENTLDVLELDAASNNSVDNVRDLLEQVRYPAQVGKYKVYIIDEVHMLSSAAFNALLKTLEEPPEHVVFILATTEPQRIPATILSRVQRFDFGRIPMPLMIARMEQALAQLGVTAEPEALRMVARAAEGALRDAFSILDMCVSAATEGTLPEAVVRDVLGASDRDFLFSFGDKLAAGDTAGVMEQIDVLMRSGREPQVFLREMARHLRALLTVKAVGERAAALLEVTQEDEKRYRTQAEAFTQERLLRMTEGFMRAESEMRYASSPRMGLEIAALEACGENRGVDAAALLERIAALEAGLKALAEAPEQRAYAAPTAPKTQREQAVKTEADDAPKPVINPQAVPQEKPAPTEDKEIWDKTMQLLAKTDPPIFGLLKKERFLGAVGDVYRVQVAFVRKDFTYLQLNRENRREAIAKALTQVAGRPLHFEATLEDEGSAKRQNDLRDENERTLIHTFGRDAVQIDDEDAPS
ncbi:MAG: DNA polymerase III subunit gamma/tau [Eubacteriales bacterium]|nr:DNA polymerase III subunit gamma/tau [Eubacteriales bacterium]